MQSTLFPDYALGTEMLSHESRIPREPPLSAAVSATPLQHTDLTDTPLVTVSQPVTVGKVKSPSPLSQRLDLGCKLQNAQSPVLLPLPLGNECKSGAVTS